ncbi:hypothetical protein [Amycolatopsis sp. WAC 04197]|uniref:hypothetical protein n=1 Tax=Amycolatopsis sp. WAC 04197 TaxID=2203199 RepID=UPI00131507D9|nr:hypothetical protein [Amycolatopsis sp. WAC 04197]
MNVDPSAIQAAIRENQGAASFAPPPAWAAPNIAEPVHDKPAAARFCTDGHRLRFPTERAALARLAEIQDRPADPDRLYNPVRVRDCRKCGGFHLTSNPGKAWRSGKTPRTIRSARRQR